MAKLHGDPLYMRRHGTTDSGRFGIHLSLNVLKTCCWNHPILRGPNSDPVPFGDPEGVGQRIFDHTMHLKGTFGPESPFGHRRKLARRPLCQAEENFAWWEGKQTRGNDAVQWGFKQQIMGIQSAKIKSTRELIAAAGQCSWQRSPSQNHVQRMSKAATDGTWSC